MSQEQMSGASFYRVNSDSTLEQLQKQMQEKAMASGSMEASEHLDRIAPDPGPLPMPKRATGATGTESLPIQSRPSMRTLHSALDNEVLGRLVSAAETGSKDEVPLGHDQCRQACIDRLCIILLLPIGVVLHGQPRWVAIVRVAAVLMGTVLWASCLYTTITGAKHWVANGQLLAARVGSYSEPDPLVAESFQQQLQGVQCTCEGCHAVPKHGSSPKVGHQMAHPCDHGKPRLLDDLPRREGPTCGHGRRADDMASRRVALPPMPLSCGLGFMATAFERVCQRARGCVLPQLRE